MISEEDKDNIDLAMTIRSLYIIGPDKKVKLMMVYPTSTGRNIQWVVLSKYMHKVKSLIKLIGKYIMLI